jgi:hypothetical protein
VPPPWLHTARQRAKAAADDRWWDLPEKRDYRGGSYRRRAAIYEKAEALVTQGIRLRFGEDGYILRGGSVTGFLDVARNQGGPGGWKLVVDEDVLVNRIAGVASTYVNRIAVDARFRMVGGSPTQVTKGQNGYKVDVAATKQSVMDAIQSYKGGNRLQVEMTVKVTKRISPTPTSRISTRPTCSALARPPMPAPPRNAHGTWALARRRWTARSFPRRGIFDGGHDG